MYWAGGCRKPDRILIYRHSEKVIGAVAGFNLVGLPNLFGIPIRGMLLFSPDLSWPAVLAGAAAALGAVLLPSLTLLRTRSVTASAGASD